VPEAANGRSRCIPGLLIVLPANRFFVLWVLAWTKDSWDATSYLRRNDPTIGPTFACR